jgi:D-xylose 1-dehydrogenase (NADP+, D-xylono-1,5-lactone-forming)
MSTAGNTPLRVGFLSTAKINDLLLDGASRSEEVEVVAVASRDKARADEYASARGIERAHGSYEALLGDPDVDAIYISVPNSLHHEWTMRSLHAGKHVLCEKPYTRRASEVDEAFDAADRDGLVLMEAFMWRHHPQSKQLKDLVDSGAIGELRVVRAAFGFTLTRERDVRLDPALDGGSLMDVGCYCVNASRLLAGRPETVTGQAVEVGGVDLRFTGTLSFTGGALAHFDCGFDVPDRSELVAVGSEGELEVFDPWHSQSPGLELRRAGEPSARIEVEWSNRYHMQWENFARAVRREEAPLLDRADALGQARTIDALYRAAAEGRTVAV